MRFSRTPSPFKARVEEAVAQNLSSRFSDTIPKVIPDCYIDLLPRGGNRNINTAVFPRTSQIESFQTDEKSTAEFLAAHKIKTVGLLNHFSVSKMFSKKTRDELKDEIAAYAKSCADLFNSESAITDGFIFDGADGRCFAYTDTLLPHTQKQIAARFSTFLKSDGAIVSIQSRILPITCLALHAEETSAQLRTNRSSLFCETTGHEIHIWIAVNCGNEIISPLVSESIESVGGNNTSFVSYSIESVCAQAEKQYRMWNPTLAILIDGSENDENHSEIHKTLSAACNGNVLEMEKDVSQNASLHGAILLGDEKL
jgi:hypothetical protein